MTEQTDNLDIRQILQTMYDELPKDDDISSLLADTMAETVRTMLRNYPVERPHQTAAIAISFVIPMLDVEEGVRTGLMMIAAKLWGES